MVEFTELAADGIATPTVAVESPDSDLVSATVRRLGLEGRPNTCVAKGLRALLDWEPGRFAVFDVGTNSLKLIVGNRRHAGVPRVELDTAVVTRLGEGLAETSELSPRRCGVPATTSPVSPRRAAGKGRPLLQTEWREPLAFFSIRGELAGNPQDVASIADALRMESKELAPFLANLELLRLVSRRRPVGSAVSSRSTQRKCTDHFVRSWFRFVQPFQAELVGPQPARRLDASLTSGAVGSGNPVPCGVLSPQAPARGGSPRSVLVTTRRS